MNLGENIYKLRTEEKMSQGDLANALEVSRQSVSKWENNTAVPELDKLIKMSELFGVTLDELVGRQTRSNEEDYSGESQPQPVQQVVIHHQFRPLSVRKIIGAILIFFGFLFFPFALSATAYKPMVICLILFSSFFLCGISVLLFRYPYIACGWVLLSAYSLYIFLLTHWEYAFFSLGMIAFWGAILILWTIHAQKSGTVCVPVWLWWLGGILLALLFYLFCINFLPPIGITSSDHMSFPS